MIICFNCSREMKKTLDYLLESGQYKDYAEVISSAVENLAILQGELAHQGAIVIETVDSGTVQITSPPNKPTEENSRLIVSATDKVFRLPEIFLMKGIENPPTTFAPLPNDNWNSGQDIPLDRWVFGQYNKLLPAKVNCRALAHLLNGQLEGIPVEEATLQIPEKAAILGDFLLYHDKKNNLSRDDALVTAFPLNKNSVEKAQKSRLRYANQFVASVNKEGQVSGLLFDLKLINYSEGKKPHLLLTEVGWKFAVLQNPILDDIQETPIQKFSDEEIILFLNHIALSVPAEDFAYRAILTSITEGSNTPDMIDAALQKYVPQQTERNFSKSFLSSQRSGAISRMADLGLVTRVRDGVRVSYMVTETGKKYLQNGNK
jgi:hypothetical protein